MNRRFIAATVMFTLAAFFAVALNPMLSFAQMPSAGGRFSVGADWKMSRGTHLTLGYGLYTRDGLGEVERHQLSSGFSHKFSRFFRAGVEYDFIGKYNSSLEYKPRHRFSAIVIGSVDAGLWRFSLKESLQYTHSMYTVNRYQEPLNKLQLKSRIKASYRGGRKLEPYVFTELRNTFNEPSCSYMYNEQTGKYSDYKFNGYSSVYVNRVRLALGTEWSIARQHTIDFYYYADFTNDHKFDTNKEGTKLKSETWERGWNHIIGIGYCFNF